MLLQIKKKLPKVNRVLAKRLLEDEELEAIKKDTTDVAVDVNVDVNTTKKASKKRKGLTSDVLQDERFTSLFKNEVSLSL